MADNNKITFSANSVVSCVLYAVIGILLIALRSGSLGILFTVVGVLFVAMGIYDFVKRLYTRGAVETVVGVVILVCGWTVAEWVLLIFGVLLIIKGVLDIVNDYKSGFKAIISPIVITVIGVVLVVSKFALIDVMCIVAGVIFLVNAVLILFDRQIV